MDPLAGFATLSNPSPQALQGIADVITKFFSICMPQIKFCLFSIANS